jgi:hypothetical protein
MISRFAFRRTLLLLVLALFFVHPLAAQPHREARPPAPNWTGDLAVASANGLIGGVTAGLMQKMSGGSFQDGFTRGMLGGAVTYGGKRLAVQSFFGAGLAGREVAAVGSSMVRAAAASRPFFQQTMLPVGPVHVYIEREEGLRVHAKLDAYTLGWMTYAALTPELKWDAKRSLSAGAPVFLARDRLIVAGRDSSEAAGHTVAGTILLSDIPAAFDLNTNFAHERVHVLQNDQMFLLWTEPAKQWALSKVPGGKTLSRYVDFNLSPAVTELLGLAFPEYHSKPWELEAIYLTERK